MRPRGITSHSWYASWQRILSVVKHGQDSSWLSGGNGPLTFNSDGPGNELMSGYSRDVACSVVSCLLERVLVILSLSFTFF